MLHLSHPLKTPIPSPHLHQRTQLHSQSQSQSPFLSPNPLKYPKPITKTPLSLSLSSPSIPKAISNPQNPPKPSLDPQNPTKKSFWAAVGLIIGTAVGPGMLGLPSATIKSGPLPSTVAIVLSWVYVVSSIVLVAELSFATMRESNVQEVSFTLLATNAFGPNFGAFVALVYSCLSFSLMIACVSGIGSLIMQQLPLINPVVAHSIVPISVAIVIGYFPFKAIDVTNRLLCSLMLVSITALVVIGLSIGRSNLMSSLSFASWRLSSILPAIPVTVLTLGFHVVTPFVCKIVGDLVYDARKAILLGGSVPLLMVVSWNAVVLGLAGGYRENFVQPIELLLSVSSSALPAVKGFAFTALATSLIGYAVSFPKQLVDTLRLIGDRLMRNSNGGVIEESTIERENASSNWIGVLATWTVLIVPIFIASFFPTAFSRALDFAGVYANCFLFGILPPAMAWIHRSRKKFRSSTQREDLLPGGSLALAVLFIIAVILGIWH